MMNFLMKFIRVVFEIAFLCVLVWGIVIDLKKGHIPGAVYQAIFFIIFAAFCIQVHSKIRMDVNIVECKGSLGFKPVTADKQKNTGDTKIPVRSTKYAAGYDFFAKADYKAESGEIIKVWTDVKCNIPTNDVLILAPRSSMGGKWMLANTVGVIDADYYGNENNDGNIGFFLKNISNETLEIKAGEKCGQGFVVPFVTFGDKVEAERKGGFGSTGK